MPKKTDGDQQKKRNDDLGEDETDLKDEAELGDDEDLEDSDDLDSWELEEDLEE